MNIRKIYITVFILFSLISCKKESTPNSNENIQIKECVIKWEGAYQVDGCGYFIFIDSVKYKPTNESEISDEFQSVYGIKVRISFEYEGQITYNCGDVPEPKIISGLKIISMEKI